MKDSIVFFAPNSQLAALASNVIMQMNLSIPVVEAYDYQAIEALRKYPSCKIAISRGGTAGYLKGVKGLSVVDLSASYYDIQKGIIELIQKGCRRISVISQNNVIGLTPAEFSMGDVSVSINPCRNAEEIISTVNKRVQQGCDGVLV